MTPKEFHQLGHAPHLKVFLESPTGLALLSVIEGYGEPSNAARKQYGDAEDVKLQMSLSYVAMCEAFAIRDLIKGLVKPLAAPVTPKTVAPDFLPDDATPEQLRARGIPPPEHRTFAKPTEPEPAPSHARRRRTPRS